MNTIRVIFVKDITNFDIFGDYCGSKNSDEIIIPKDTKGTIKYYSGYDAWVCPDNNPENTYLHTHDCFEVLTSE